MRPLVAAKSKAPFQHHLKSKVTFEYNAPQRAISQSALLESSKRRTLHISLLPVLPFHLRSFTTGAVTSTQTPRRLTLHSTSLCKLWAVVRVLTDAGSAMIGHSSGAWVHAGLEGMPLAASAAHFTTLVASWNLTVCLRPASSWHTSCGCGWFNPVEHEPHGCRALSQVGSKNLI